MPKHDVLHPAPRQGLHQQLSDDVTADAITDRIVHNSIIIGTGSHNMPTTRKPTNNRSAIASPNAISSAPNRNKP